MPQKPYNYFDKIEIRNRNAWIERNSSPNGLF